MVEFLLDQGAGLHHTDNMTTDPVFMASGFVEVLTFLFRKVKPREIDNLRVSM